MKGAGDFASLDRMISVLSLHEVDLAGLGNEYLADTTYLSQGVAATCESGKPPEAVQPRPNHGVTE
jgi:hypothetical protein